MMGLARLRKPFRTPKSRRALMLFLIGLATIILTSTLSYIGGDLYFYGGLAGVFGFMCAAFVMDPLVYTITNVRIFDLVVSTGSVSIARYMFGSKSGILDENLFSGALSGMKTLARETLLSNSDLRCIQTGNKAVLITKTPRLTVYLVTDQVNRICLVAMDILGRRVEKHYQRNKIAWHESMDPVLFAA